MEASIFARWIDRTYRPQLGKLTQGLLGELGEAGLQQALQQAALRHLTSPTSTTGLQACVQAQQEHEQAQFEAQEPSVLRCSRRRELEDDEAELCQQLMELLEGFMSDYSNARYTDPQAKLDALELKLQARRSANPNPNPSSSPSPSPSPSPNPSPSPGQVI